MADGNTPSDDVERLAVDARERLKRVRLEEVALARYHEQVEGVAELTASKFLERATRHEGVR